MAAINPQILTWARETAGLSLDRAAHAIGLQPSRGQTGAERLAEFEAGTKEPSRPQLLKIAKAYRRPLLVFYLADPPRTGDRGQDFRTLPGRERFNPELDALVRDIKARQGLIRSMLEDNDEAQRLNFIASVTTDIPVERLAVEIAHRLRFSLSEFRSARTPDDAFTYLRATIEHAGVFVILLGNLGSHHSNLPVEIFRGFALADPIAPLIVINDQDAPAAWCFTALHELVHLWLGQTGVSGVDIGNAIEQYCNDVAGEILVPARELDALNREFAQSKTFDHTVGAIVAFARDRRVSRTMVAYKLFRVGLITQPFWSKLQAHFTKEWREFKQREAEKNRAVDGGPSYYVVRRHRIGPAVLDLVRRSLHEGNITHTKAGRVLGVNPRNVEPLLSLEPVRAAR
jgi:Zn-dependent peptidase ImmA (M78 family)